MTSETVASFLKRTACRCIFLRQLKRLTDLSAAISNAIVYDLGGVLGSINDSTLGTHSPLVEPGKVSVQMFSIFLLLTFPFSRLLV